MIPVDDREALPHQFATEALALLPSVNTEPGKVPMQELRVGSVHLPKKRQEVFMLLGRDGLRHHSDDRIAIRLNMRGEPQRHSGELAEPPHGTCTERLAAKCRQE